ncbi:MAG: enoyl-CoA hydratase-related protein [Zetaproteobacteria bacterium]|nr:enoyl-CoA hydratase-related protein [Zetaproteobacteria bacterium]
MENYTSIQIRRHTAAAMSGIVDIVLMRPEKANALDMVLIEELTESLKHLRRSNGIRLLQLKAVGKHFCAGADLEWMKHSVELSQEENLHQTRKMAQAFKLLYEFPCLTIAYPFGGIYGGGVGICAACDFVIAQPQARFCLSEVKLGLIPAVILPYLHRRMGLQKLRYAAHAAQMLDAEEALSVGLVDHVLQEDKGGGQLMDFVKGLLSGGTEAQRALKALEQKIFPIGADCMEQTCQQIATLRQQSEAQEGLRAFFAGATPAWKKPLPSLTEFVGHEN